MADGDPYTTVTEPTFVARFLLSPGIDTAETVANVDAFVELPDGSTWALTIFTVAEVARLLAKWKDNGEVAHGSYFWVVDQVIVPEPGIPAMTAAIRELVRSGDLASAGIRRDDDKDDDKDDHEDDGRDDDGPALDDHRHDGGSEG